MIIELLWGGEARIGDGDQGGGTIGGGVQGQGGVAREDGMCVPSPAADHIREDPWQHSRLYEHDESGIVRSCSDQVGEQQAVAMVVGDSVNAGQWIRDGRWRGVLACGRDVHREAADQVSP